MTEEEVAIVDIGLDFYNKIRRLESCAATPIPLDQFRREIAAGYGITQEAT